MVAMLLSFFWGFFLLQKKTMTTTIIFSPYFVVKKMMATVNFFYPSFTMKKATTRVLSFFSYCRFSIAYCHWLLLVLLSKGEQLVFMVLAS
jgi:hypothetical protein